MMFTNPLVIFIIILLLQIILMLSLAGAKARGIVKTKEAQKRYDYLLPLYLDYLISGDEKEKALLLERDDEPAIIEKILMDYTKNIRGSIDHQYVYDIATMKLQNYYEKQLAGTNWGFRMNAILAIERFNLEYFTEDLWTMLLAKKELDEEAVQLQKTLARLNKKELIPYMIEKWKMTERDFSEILDRYDEKVLSYMIEVAENVDHSDFLHAVIRRVAVEDHESYFFFITKFLESENIETRLCALQSIKNMRNYLSSIDITPFFHSEHWQERMFAANISGIIRKNEYKEHLYKLIGDESWWVRYRAAEAINQYEDGEVMLRYIAEDHEDRYAKNMAEQWIGSVS